MFKFVAPGVVSLPRAVTGELLMDVCGPVWDALYGSQYQMTWREFFDAVVALNADYASGAHVQGVPIDRAQRNFVHVLAVAASVLGGVKKHPDAVLDLLTSDD